MTEKEKEENLENLYGLREKIEKSTFFWLIKILFLLILTISYIILGLSVDRLQVKEFIADKGYDVKEVYFRWSHWKVETE